MVLDSTVGGPVGSALTGGSGDSSLLPMVLGLGIGAGVLLLLLVALYWYFYCLPPLSQPSRNRDASKYDEAQLEGGRVAAAQQVTAEESADVASAEIILEERLPESEQRYDIEAPTTPTPRMKATASADAVVEVASTSTGAQIVATFPPDVRLGIALTVDVNGKVRVTEVGEGSHAAQQGVPIMAILIDINGQSTAGLSQLEVLKLIAAATGERRLVFNTDPLPSPDTAPVTLDTQSSGTIDDVPVIKSPDCKSFNLPRLPPDDEDDVPPEQLSAQRRKQVSANILQELHAADATVGDGNESNSGESDESDDDPKLNTDYRSPKTDEPLPPLLTTPVPPPEPAPPLPPDPVQSDLHQSSSSWLTTLFGLSAEAPAPAPASADSSSPATEPTSASAPAPASASEPTSAPAPAPASLDSHSEEKPEASLDPERQGSDGGTVDVETLRTVGERMRNVRERARANFVFAAAIEAATRQAAGGPEPTSSWQKAKDVMWL